MTEFQDPESRHLGSARAPLLALLGLLTLYLRQLFVSLQGLFVYQMRGRVANVYPCVPKKLYNLGVLNLHHK